MESTDKKPAPLTQQEQEICDRMQRAYNLCNRKDFPQALMPGSYESRNMVVLKVYDLLEKADKGQ